MKILNLLALLLTLVGALNWGLWGFFQFDLVAWLAHGQTSGMARVIYSLVGLGGVWSLRMVGKLKGICDSSGKGSGCCR